MQEQDKTQYIGCGKVKKVMVLKTSEEVKQARIRERQRQRYLAAQQTMLQAVEQAVALPEPTPHTPCEEAQAIAKPPIQETADATTKKVTLRQSLREWMKGARDSATAIFDNMYSMMMEGD
jgi:aspartate/glutamate racemase